MRNFSVNTKTTSSMTSRVLGTLITIVLFGLLSACGGGSGDTPTPTPTPGAVNYVLSAEGIAANNISEKDLNAVQVSVQIQSDNQVNQKLDSTLSDEQLYVVTLEENLNPQGKEKLEDMANISLFKNSQLIAKGVYHVSVTTDANGLALFDLDETQAKATGNLSGLRHVKVLSITQNGQAVAINKAQDELPEGLNVQVPVKFFVAQDEKGNKTPITANIELSHGTPVYLGAEITPDYNESKTVYFTQVNDALSARRYAPNDALPSVTIDASDADNVNYSEAYPLLNPVAENMDGQTKTIQLDADPAANGAVDIEHNSFLITIDSAPYIQWDPKGWPSDTVMPATGDLVVHLTSLPEVGVKTSQGFISDTTQVIDGGSCMIAPSASGVSCTYHEGLWTISGMNVLDRSMQHTLTLTYQSGDSIQRTYGNLNINPAVKPGQDSIVWTSQDLSIATPISAPDSISGSGTFSAQVKHEDGTTQEATYTCKIINHNGAQTSGSHCSVDGSKHITAAIPSYTYDNQTTQNVYHLILTANDPAEGPEKAASLDANPVLIPFPVITNQSATLNFEVNDEDNIATSTIKPILPKVSNGYTEKDVYMHGDEALSISGSDPVTLTDGSGGSFVKDPQVTLEQGLNNYPDFKWKTQFMVDIDQVNIVVNTAEFIKNVGSIALDETDKTSARSSGYLNFSAATVENGPEGDIVDPDLSSCSVVSEQGTLDSGDCALVRGANDTQYQIQITGLDNTQTNRYVQVTLNDRDKKASSYNVFNPASSGIQIPDDQPIPPSNILFSAYKDTSINMNWNTNVISTKVTGTDEPVAFLSVLPENNKAVTWAFATGDCANEEWGQLPGSKLSEANIQNFVDQDVDYIISTGGAVAAFTCGNVENLSAFINRYASKNMIGIDYDIEVTYTEAQIKQLLQVTADYQKSHPNFRVSLTLATAAVEGNTINIYGIWALEAAQKVGLKFNVNLMVMDYGLDACQTKNQGTVCDMAASAIFAAQEFSRMYDIPLSRIELTPMLGYNDIVNEITSIDDIKNIATFVKEHQLAGMHYWAFDRDVPCDQTTPASAECSGPSSGTGAQTALNFNQSIINIIN